MSAYLFALMGGFIGSFHCIGMCGGFACGLAQADSQNAKTLLLKSISYNLGRLTTYVFIGALVGLLGNSLLGPSQSSHMHSLHMHESKNEAETGQVQNQMAQSAPPMGSDHAVGSIVFFGNLGWGQRFLSVIAGLLMVVVALQLLGIRRHVPVGWGRIGGLAAARVLQSLLRSNHLSASLALGVANGFLPCPLVYAFAAAAAATASVQGGILTMLAFGLGTFPAMFFMSGVGRAVSPLIRQRGVRVGGAFVLAIGVFTVVRGLLPGLMHGPMH